jgi:LAO/AO transport system kinase
MYETIEDHLKSNFYQNKMVKSAIATVGKSVSEDKISPFIAAQELLDKYFDAISKH